MARSASMASIDEIKSAVFESSQAACGQNTNRLSRCNALVCSQWSKQAYLGVVFSVPPLMLDYLPRLDVLKCHM